MDFGLQIVTTCWSSNKLLSHGLQVISILMPQAKTPKPGFVDRCPVSNAWSSDPYAPVPTCHCPSGSQNQCRCVMFLACQIADAASCLRKITNRINLWMAQPRDTDLPPFIKKMARKREPCISVPTLLRATCCYNTSSKAVFGLLFVKFFSKESCMHVH